MDRFLLVKRYSFHNNAQINKDKKKMDFSYVYS